MQITIPEIPISQIRMKHSFIHGISRVYDPKAKDKKRIKEYFLSLPHKKFKHPHISFLCYFPIPKSTRKRDLAVYQSGLLKHEKKPDIDNIVKLLLDCMDGIFFDGDQSVSLGICMKLYHTAPRTEIYISETTALVKPEQLLISDKDYSGETSYPSGFESPSHPDVSKSHGMTSHLYAIAQPPESQLARPRQV